MNERFETDLDDMMACYQSRCSPLGLPRCSENDSRKAIHSHFNTSCHEQVLFLQTRLFLILITWQTIWLLSSARIIAHCNLLRNHVPKSDPAGGWTRNDRQYNIITSATVLNCLPNFLSFNTFLTYPYHLTWSATYLSRENFTLSLSKSIALTLAWPLYWYG